MEGLPGQPRLELQLAIGEPVGLGEARGDSGSWNADLAPGWSPLSSCPAWEPLRCVCLGYCFLTWCLFPSRLDVSASGSCLFLSQPLAHLEPHQSHPYPTGGAATPVHCGRPGPGAQGTWPDSETLETTHADRSPEAGEAAHPGRDLTSVCLVVCMMSARLSP